jgi:hypothetical protein
MCVKVLGYQGLLLAQKQDNFMDFLRGLPLGALGPLPTPSTARESLKYAADSGHYSTSFLLLSPDMRLRSAEYASKVTYRQIRDWIHIQPNGTP